MSRSSDTNVISLDACRNKPSLDDLADDEALGPRNSTSSPDGRHYLPDPRRPGKYLLVA